MSDEQTPTTDQPERSGVDQIDLQTEMKRSYLDYAMAVIVGRALPDVRDGLKNGHNTEAAAKVGKAIAEKAKAAGIEKVAFDRSGYRYHGRVKALAEAAREGGLQF